MIRHGSSLPKFRRRWHSIGDPQLPRTPFTTRLFSRYLTYRNQPVNRYLQANYFTFWTDSSLLKVPLLHHCRSLYIYGAFSAVSNSHCLGRLQRLQLLKHTFVPSLLSRYSGFNPTFLAIQPPCQLSIPSTSRDLDCQMNYMSLET